MRLSALIGVAVTACLLAGPVTASIQIPDAYRKVAQEYNVPAGILFAIALAESRPPKTYTTKPLPWPWTLNVNGRGHYFWDRQAAIKFLKDRIAAGHKPDVGLMQVNWGWHSDKLGSPAKAFNPWTNLRAGALVLREEYLRTGDWWQAVGNYHSNTPARAQAYRERVLRWYRRII